MQKVCAKIMPKILTFEQQEIYKKFSTDTLNAIENDPNLLERIVTCVASWFFLLIILKRSTNPCTGRA